MSARPDPRLFARDDLETQRPELACLGHPFPDVDSDLIISGNPAVRGTRQFQKPAVLRRLKIDAFLVQQCVIWPSVPFFQKQLAENVRGVFSRQDFEDNVDGVYIGREDGAGPVRFVAIGLKDVFGRFIAMRQFDPGKESFRLRIR